MSLIHCPECKIEVSSHAPACPQCGFPVSGRGALAVSTSRLPWLITAAATLALVIVVIIFLATRGGGGEGTAVEKSAAAPASVKSAAAPPPEDTAAAGETVAAAAGEPAPEGTAAEPAPEEAAAGEPVVEEAAAAEPAQDEALQPPAAEGIPEEERLYGPGKKVGRYWVTKDVVVDLRQRRLWQRGASKRKLTWGAALSYCKKLELDGLKGWKMPTILQLKGLLRGCASPGKCGHFKSGISCRHCRDNSGPGDNGWFMQRGAWHNPKYPWFWASTPHASYKGYHYSMFFAGAYINYYKNSEPYHARCFRPAE